MTVALTVVTSAIDQDVVATPTWFGPVDRRLFGWVHTPEGGSVRGGVVLCPPLGIEAICTYFTYRVLASRLAAKGLAVVRFDYDGTGDSVGGEDEPGRVEAWVASSTAAADLLRAAGVQAIGLVGIRMGAIFAAEEAARSGGVDALVLWDPCLSGRSFLREQQALRRLSLGGPSEPGFIDLPGIRLDRHTAESIRQLTLGGEGVRLAGEVLVLERPDRTQRATLAEYLDTASVEWALAHGQDALLDPPRQETPWDTIGAVSEWIGGKVDGASVDFPAVPSGRAFVAVAADGERVTELPVDFGPGLFGILSEPTRRRPGPVVVLVDEGNTPHIGQSRLWVELGRHWSSLGFEVLRFDLSGNGDSQARPGQMPHGVLDPEAIEDVLAAAEFVSPDDRRNVVLVGLCSGAYEAMEAALILRPRGLLLINPYNAFVPPELGLGRLPSRSAVQATRAWLTAIGSPAVRWAASHAVFSSAKDPVQALSTGAWLAATARRHPGLPDWLWDMVAAVTITDSPMSVFERLVASGVDIMVACGRSDAISITAGQSARLRRLGRSPMFELRVLDQLDHAVLLVDERRRLEKLLTDHLLALVSPGTERRAGPGRRSTARSPHGSIQDLEEAPRL